MAKANYEISQNHDISLYYEINSDNYDISSPNWQKQLWNKSKSLHKKLKLWDKHKIMTRLTKNNYDIYKSILWDSHNHDI